MLYARKEVGELQMREQRALGKASEVERREE